MRERFVQGIRVPAFMYGTAWKEDRTAELTGQALSAGFRAIDTANQRKHYFEAAVGDAVAAAIGARRVRRDELFLQTKFTHADGQDHRLPYDRDADLATQVRQSVASSLEHLKTTYLDSYILHGPSSRRGLGSGDWAVWRAMEALHAEGKTRLLGVSNVSLEQLRALHAEATVRPGFVQNRCYASRGWDRELRTFCAEHGIVYQGFSLLTANSATLRSTLVKRIAQRHGFTPAQVVFSFALQVGMIPLTGTSSPAHMNEDLACSEFSLDSADLEAIERLET
jgi:diketogulonate reductase-like aldo/keto reductase